MLGLRPGSAVAFLVDRELARRTAGEQDDLGVIDDAAIDALPVYGAAKPDPFVAVPDELRGL